MWMSLTTPRRRGGRGATASASAVAWNIAHEAANPPAENRRNSLRVVAVFFIIAFFCFTCWMNMTM